MLKFIKKILGLNYYESELDLFLHDYDKSCPHLSHSQSKELSKYQRIFRLRDKAEAPHEKSRFWEGF